MMPSISASPIYGACARQIIPSLRLKRQSPLPIRFSAPVLSRIDFESEEDGAVTVRDRDTMEQVRLPIDQLVAYINEKLEF